MIVIIGSGLAGYNFVREFRTHDQNTPIRLITQDAGDFYPKPQLSTSIGNNKTASDLITMTAKQMEDTYHIQIDTQTTVTSIDTKAQCVHCHQESINYTSLIIATGAETPMPFFAGNAVEHVLQVNDLYQYDTFRQAIEGKRDIAILGAGLVGTEFANDLTRGGFHTHVIDPAATPLAQLVPEQVGQRLQECFTEHGVNWHLGHVAKHIDYDQGQFTLTLDNDHVITTDIVLSAIGLKPNVALAKAAGISTNQGIVVDHHLKTSADNVYALGDCMELDGFGFLPYIAPMLQCIKALAQTLAGNPTSVEYPAMPVSVKTSLFPLCVCYPRVCSDGQWDIEDDNGTIRALYHDKEQQLRGYILTKTALKERMTLGKTVLPWV